MIEAWEAQSELGGPGPERGREVFPFSSGDGTALSSACHLQLRIRGGALGQFVLTSNQSAPLSRLLGVQFLRRAYGRFLLQRIDFIAFLQILF